MLLQEFDTEFDIQYNNILSDQAPGVNSYEKSKFLSDAEYDVVLDIYKGSSLGTPFESAEDARRYISVLNTQKTISLMDSSGTVIPVEDFYRAVYTLPEDILFITYESASIGGEEIYCTTGKKVKEAIVVPCTQDDFWRTMRSPFRRPNSARVLRLDSVGASGNGRVIELVSKYPLTSYTVRYIRKPKPIIIENLAEAYGDGVSIHGMTEKCPCELPDVLHKEILTRAVNMAKSVWLNNLNTNNNDR